jgi:hypothetical protein
MFDGKAFQVVLLGADPYLRLRLQKNYSCGVTITIFFFTQTRKVDSSKSDELRQKKVSILHTNCLSTPSTALQTMHRKMAKYEKNRSTRRSTPRHPIDMASTAKPPDPMPCALAAILLPESRAPTCHMRKTLFPGTFWVHAG